MSRNWHRLLLYKINCFTLRKDHNHLPNNVYPWITSIRWIWTKTSHMIDAPLKPLQVNKDRERDQNVMCARITVGRSNTHASALVCLPEPSGRRPASATHPTLSLQFRGWQKTGHATEVYNPRLWGHLWWATPIQSSVPVTEQQNAKCVNQIYRKLGDHEHVFYFVLNTRCYHRKQAQPRYCDHTFP